MKWFSKFVFHSILGWSIDGTLPSIKKCVIIVAPHTHWQDFIIGVLVRDIIGLEINFIGKKELFSSPLGWLFKWMGGAPVNRGSKSNTVESIVDIFNQRDVFRLALSPEGTRKKVSTWKTGFYFVAKKANVPVVPVSFDFSKKKVTIFKLFEVSDNKESDIKTLRNLFKGVVGKIPEYS